MLDRSVCACRSSLLSARTVPGEQTKLFASFGRSNVERRSKFFLNRCNPTSGQPSSAMRGRSRVRDEDNTGVRSEPSTTNAAAVISALVQSLLKRRHLGRSNKPDCNAIVNHTRPNVRRNDWARTRSLVKEPAAQGRGSPPTLVRHTDASGTAVAEEKGSARMLESQRRCWRTGSRPSQCRDISQRLAAEPNELIWDRMRWQICRNLNRHSTKPIWFLPMSRWRHPSIGGSCDWMTRNADASSKRSQVAGQVNWDRSRHQQRRLTVCLAIGPRQFRGVSSQRERPGKREA